VKPTTWGFRLPPPPLTWAGGDDGEKGSEGTEGGKEDVLVGAVGEEAKGEGDVAVHHDVDNLTLTGGWKGGEGE
jgi:hypothetical protein